MIRLTVFGIPAPQGSKKFVGTHNDRPLMAESSKKVGPWRNAVKRAAKVVMAGRAPLDGPLVAVMTFTLPKPTSAPKTRRTWPCRYPDASKLARSTEDALTDAGVWVDDARVVDLVVHKRYPNEGRNALPAPGVVVEVSGFGEFEVIVRPTEISGAPIEQTTLPLVTPPANDAEVDPFGTVPPRPQREHVR